jgi:hypothetical protein
LTPNWLFNYSCTVVLKYLGISISLVLSSMAADDEIGLIEVGKQLTARETAVLGKWEERGRESEVFIPQEGGKALVRTIRGYFLRRPAVNLRIETNGELVTKIAWSKFDPRFAAVDEWKEAMKARIGPSLFEPVPEGGKPRDKE